VIDAMADAIATAMSIGVPPLAIALVAWYFLPELPLRDHTEIAVDGDRGEVGAEQREWWREASVSQPQLSVRSLT
jgi:hypothetical protein